MAVVVTRLKNTAHITNISYNTRNQLVSLPDLETRRRRAMIFFLYKLLNGVIDSSSLTERIYFRIPQRSTRQRRLFLEIQHRTNYGSRRIMHRLLKNYNDHYSNYDLFRYSFETFKKHILSI